MLPPSCARQQIKGDVGDETKRRSAGTDWVSFVAAFSCLSEEWALPSALKLEVAVVWKTSATSKRDDRYVISLTGAGPLKALFLFAILLNSTPDWAYGTNKSIVLFWISCCNMAVQTSEGDEGMKVVVILTLEEFLSTS